MINQFELVKATQKDFDLFKREVNKWMKIYSMGDWEYVVVWGSEIDEGVMAQIVYDIEAMLVSFKFCTEMPRIDHRNERIKSIAQHEVIELLLTQLKYACLIRNSDADRVEAETHAVIHRIQNAKGTV